MKKNRDYILYIIMGLYLFPILITVITSLETLKEVDHIVHLKLIPSRVTLRQYYLLFFEKEQYILMFWKSIKITLAIVSLNTIYSVFVGIILVKTKLRWNKIIFMLYLLGSIVPYQVYMLSHYIQFNKIGIFDTDYALIFPQIFSPFGVVLISLFITKIPDELIEVIRLETNSIYKIVSYGIIPNIKGGIVLLMILCFSENWNLVEQPLAMITEKIRQPLSVFLSYMGNDQEIIFAACVVYSIPSIILYTLFEECLNNQYIEIKL